MNDEDRRQYEKELRALRKKLDRVERARRQHEELAERNANLFKTLREEVAQQAEVIRGQNEDLARELAVAQEYRAEALRRIEGPLIGDSPVVQGLRAAVERYAEQEEPLLLVSPPGCGAEAIARAIHDASPRRDGPFVMVECAIVASASHAAILHPASGDSDSPPTKYELARGGTLYLDGVDQLRPDMQRSLLEILQKPGGDRPDVRIIGYAKSIPFPPGYEAVLELELARNQLRLPTLSERRDDIPDLVEHFLRRYSRQLGKVLDGGVSEESLARMKTYSWPGNLRELDEVIRRSVVSSLGNTLQVDTALMEEGVSLGGYRLARRLGVGGMGEVWEAKHQLLTRRVAIKLVKPEALGSSSDREQILRRFRREAQVTANLRCTNTVDLYDFGVNDEGTFYYVMELLDGLNLEELIQQFGPPDIARAVSFLVQACNSLAEAHAAGLVHRDIKPANLYTCKLGLQVDVLKVLDFGLVTGLGSEEATRMTQAGVSFGTPTTMSPEACLNSADVDGRADIYSLGCVGYWLLAGRMPFESDNMTQLLLKHVGEAPPSLNNLGVEIPPELDELLLRCLAKTPAERPAADEFSKVLEATGLAREWSQADAQEWWSANIGSIYDSPLDDIPDAPT